jgi:hypothetical protein
VWFSIPRLEGAIRAGVELPPLVVYRNWRGDGWGLLDGSGRTNALVASGVRTTRAYELLQDRLPTR